MKMVFVRYSVTWQPLMLVNDEVVEAAIDADIRSSRVAPLDRSADYFVVDGDLIRYRHGQRVTE